MKIKEEGIYIKPYKSQKLILTFLISVSCFISGMKESENLNINKVRCIRVTNLQPLYTLRQKLSTTLCFYRYIFLHQYC